MKFSAVKSVLLFFRRLPSDALEDDDDDDLLRLRLERLERFGV